MTRYSLIFVLLGLLTLAFHEISDGRGVFLATTTSVRDTGLLKELLPNVKAIGVGSGQALQMGLRKEADLLITHYPKLELQFMADGFGIQRRAFMYNRFVIVGPVTDPAGIAQLGTLAEAFKAISTSRERFISRGDGSGTHAREIAIWGVARASPFSTRYVSTGTGMGSTLATAESLKGYTLTDETTFTSLKPKLRLFRFDDEMTLNLYSAILVSELARDTFHFITSPKVAPIIEGKGFFPCRDVAGIKAAPSEPTDSRMICPRMRQ
ncbi:MAG: tungsten ABC transporter substrate-binding protein [Deltaproteobacteria bacterium]|nr:tungsten ABC transporter substrate-binding protein [Deltaproteobacteria bacterium]